MTPQSSRTLLSAAVLLLVVAVVLAIAIFLSGDGWCPESDQSPQPLLSPSPSSPDSGVTNAKNVILLIGDGMGFAELTAARWEKANHDLGAYSSTALAMDRLEYSGRVTTMAADSFVTDSAAAATAIMTGVKTDRGVIGQNASAVRGVSDGARLMTLAELAMAKGRATGVVTTTRITDATPAGIYAHINDRNDETLIAEQFLDSGIDVALGGGYRSFINETREDPWGKEGERTDGRDLIAEARAQGYTIVSDSSHLEAASLTSGTRVIGLFDSSTLDFEPRQTGSGQPALAGMTAKAIALLDADPDGFFLMVEGGRIDQAASSRDYEHAAAETLAFDDAVKEALDYAAQHPDTLLIVTADHETGGLILEPSGEGGVTPIYSSGSKLTRDEKGLVFDESASHTAVDVPIMATGPGADRFGHGTIDNTQIFQLMREAMGI